MFYTAYLSGSLGYRTSKQNFSVVNTLACQQRHFLLAENVQFCVWKTLIVYIRDQVRSDDSEFQCLLLFLYHSSLPPISHLHFPVTYFGERHGEAATYLKQYRAGPQSRQDAYYPCNMKSTNSMIIFGLNIWQQIFWHTSHMPACMPLTLRCSTSKLSCIGQCFIYIYIL